MRIKKVCGLCQRVFVAKKTTTEYCSDECVKKAYKIRKRQEKLETTREETQQKLTDRVLNLPTPRKEKTQEVFVNVLTLAAATGFSRSTLFRLMADKDFPRIQTSKRSVKFHLETVINYLNEKYGSV